MVYDSYFSLSVLLCHPIQFHSLFSHVKVNCRKLRWLSPNYVSVGFLSLFYKMWVL